MPNVRRETALLGLCGQAFDFSLIVMRKVEPTAHGERHNDSEGGSNAFAQLHTVVDVAVPSDSSLRRDGHDHVAGVRPDHPKAAVISSLAVTVDCLSNCGK